jgi:hypothetical protein
MAKATYCPLSQRDCVADRCRWWDDVRGRCAILMIATALRDIGKKKGVLAE